MKTQLSILTIATLSQLGATDCGTVLRDPGFDLWCGDALCTWKVVRGDVAQVPTWHEKDRGVELLGDDAAIAQLTPVNSGDGTCIRFDLVANIDEGAEARLGIDVFGDGTVELSERMPTARWQPLSYKISIAAPYSGVRFELSKRGSGRAVFAQIAATIDTGCEGLPVLSGGPAPLGAPCEDGTTCESGLCDYVPVPGSWFGIAKACVACTTACGAGEVCGLDEPTSPVRYVSKTCVATGTRELGDRCVTDAECASDLCTANVCSECKTSCASGAACQPAYAEGPSLCAPASGTRASGAACATDGDCGSGRCDGAIRTQCTDGRPCDSPEDCPVEDDLAPGACTAVGIQGGRCG